MYLIHMAHSHLELDRENGIFFYFSSYHLSTILFDPLHIFQYNSELCHTEILRWYCYSRQYQELCHAGSRWSLKWVLSLLWKMASDSAVLTLVGSSFHHWGARTEKSCDFAVQALFALSDVSVSLYQLAPCWSGVKCSGLGVWSVQGLEEDARSSLDGLERPAPCSWIRCGLQQ